MQKQQPVYTRFIATILPGIFNLNSTQIQGVHLGVFY